MYLINLVMVVNKFIFPISVFVHAFRALGVHHVRTRKYLSY